MNNQATSPQPDSVDPPPPFYRVKESHPNYTIYLLTVWASEAGNASDPASWRFRLENPRTKESRGFVGIEALIAGLVDKMKNDLLPIVVEPYAEEYPGEK